MFPNQHYRMIVIHGLYENAEFIVIFFIGQNTGNFKKIKFRRHYYLNSLRRPSVLKEIYVDQVQTR